MITLRNVGLRRGAKVLLEQATVTVNPGERVGLIGRNGVGKTTLFALLEGSLHEDAGEFSRPAHWRLAQVAQDMPSGTRTASDFVVEGDDGHHFAALVVSAAFEGLSRVQRHQPVEGRLHPPGSVLVGRLATPTPLEAFQRIH